jgi:hypothetical protein
MLKSPSDFTSLITRDKLHLLSQGLPKYDPIVDFILNQQRCLMCGNGLISEGNTYEGTSGIGFSGRWKVLHYGCKSCSMLYNIPIERMDLG